MAYGGSTGEGMQAQESYIPDFEFSTNGLVKAVNSAIIRRASILRSENRIHDEHKPPLHPGLFNQMVERIASDKLYISHLISCLDMVTPRSGEDDSWAGYIDEQAAERVFYDAPHVELP